MGFIRNKVKASILALVLMSAPAMAGRHYYPGPYQVRFGQGTVVQFYAHQNSKAVICRGTRDERTFSLYEGQKSKRFYIRYECPFQMYFGHLESVN